MRRLNKSGFGGWCCRAAALLVAVFCCERAAVAQCPGEWLPGAGVPGVSGSVNAVVMWDSDFEGPLPPRLVVGGSFILAGSTIVHNIAVWDGTKWEGLGTGLGAGGVDAVNALAVMNNGDLAAGGTFVSAGGVTVNRVARWDGTAWAAFSGLNGIGPNGEVKSLCAMPNGQLVIGGTFTQINGVAFNRIARWGPYQVTPGSLVQAAWYPFTSSSNGSVGMPTSTAGVSALMALPNGDILVGGGHSNVGGVASTRYLARWTPSTMQWSALGDGVTNVVRSLKTAPNGDILAAGGFGVARWNGSQWTVLDDSPFTGVYASVMAIEVLPNGNIVAVGAVPRGGAYSEVGWTNSLAVWDGAAWTHWLDAAPRRERLIQAIAVMPDGSCALGSTFNLSNDQMTFADTGPGNGVCRWDGTSFSLLSDVGRPATSGAVSAISVDSAGDVLVGGEFTTIEGAPARRIARWSASAGGTWAQIGTGLDASGYIPGIATIAPLPDGRIAVGGTFNWIDYGVSPTLGNALWDGSAWAAFIPVSFSPTFHTFARASNSDLLVAGAFSNIGDDSGANNLARWDGAFTWTGFGSGLASFARTVAAMPDGSVIAGGSLIIQNGGENRSLARWDGNTWAPIDCGTGYINTSLVLPNGDLVVGGVFTNMCGVAGTSRIARWNGTEWSALGSGLSGTVDALARMPNGDIIAGGFFTAALGTTPAANRIARWDGTAWHALGGGLDAPVDALGVTPDGVLWVGGRFALADGKASAFLARWTCGAAAAAGACCTGTVCAIATDAAACAGSFQGAGSACGPPGNPTTCCKANFNQTGGVSIDDLFLFLNAWFSNDPSADIGGTSGVSIDDLFLFLNLWFTGC